MPSFDYPTYVEYDERSEDSPVYTLANGTTRVDRVFRCRWNKREAFARAILGYPSIGNTNEGGEDNIAYVSRFIPQSMPNFLDPTGREAWLYAVGISRMVGAGALGTFDANGVSEYEWAIVTVQYESLTYKVMDDNDLIQAIGELDPVDGSAYPDESYILRYITRVTKPSAEYITLPRGIMYWYTPEAASYPRVDFANARLVPSFEVTYTWHQVPFIPNAVYTHIGSVNDADFVDATKTYRAGTLLLLSAEIKPYRTAVGAFVNDITYRMKFFEPQEGRGHNFFLRYNRDQQSLSYTKITSKQSNDALAITNLDAVGPYLLAHPAQDATSIYPYRDFRELFVYGV